MKPLISVIVPVYNQERYVAECLRSVLSQVYRNLELVVINDGSTDRSLARIQQIARTDQRVIVLNTPNGGTSKARKLGLQVAKGEFIFFVDSDDLLLPHALNTLLEIATSETWMWWLEGCNVSLALIQEKNYTQLFCRLIGRLQILIYLRTFMFHISA